jgi:serine/threonine protein kinase
MIDELLATVRDELAPELDVEREIGRGRTAVVYLAREPALERLVAVKVLRPDIAAEELARRRFEREARAAARISHVNITSVYRVGAFADGLPYIVMEYIDGRTLADRIEATGSLPLDEARELLSSLASALAAAHDRGIVHRDVRPSNVFLENRSGRAVLADFGIAALRETGSEVRTRLTVAGVQLGQIEYTSPEELREEKVTEQSDVYAFGILAYMAIAGRSPYEAKGAAEFTAAHLEGSPRPLGMLRFGVDHQMADIVARCLAKDPRRRPRASDLATALSKGGSRSGAGDPHPVPAEGSVGAFLHELRRRKVYKMTAAYGTSMLALFTLAAVLNQAFLPDRWFDAFVIVGLVGFPIAVSLSWIFEIRDGKPLLTPTSKSERSGSSRWSGMLPWLGLAASIAVAGGVGWFLLL